MALVGDTGNGATFTLSAQATSFLIQKISIGESSIDMVDISHLGTTGRMEEILADLATNEEITLDVVWDTALTLPNVGAAAETGTVTFPLRTGEATAANLAGTGHFTARKLPDFANGEAQMGQFKFRFNGDTGPTYTKSVAT
jgi:hypothetical protein